jgi:membrane fusion protein (multidrug efflux system)
MPLSSRCPSMSSISPVLGACLLLGLSACQGGPAGGVPHREPPPVVVQTLRVEPIDIPRTLSAVGSIESPQSTQISAEFAGMVVFLDIPEGSEVEEGHVLARLDDRRADAAVSIARARHANARERLSRLRRLHGSGVISQQELDDAVAELDAAEGALVDARTALGQTAIQAPFAGILGLRQVSLGAYVEAGAPIVRITQVKPLHLIFSLPQRNVSQLEIGQTVRGVADSCEKWIEGKITVIDPYIDPATRSVRVQALVPNQNGMLRPGMAAAVNLEVGRIADALLIPQEAIIRQGTMTLVYTVGDDGTVSQKEVGLGEYFADRVQVVRGLAAGEVVVAAGHQKIRPGAKVIAEEYRPIENPNLALGSLGTLAECNF